MEIHNEALPYTPAPEDVYINGTLHHGTHGHMIVSGSAFEGATDVFINGYRHTQFGVRYIQIPPAVSPGWVEGFSVETDPAAAGRMPIQGAAAVTSSRGAGRIATGETCVEISVPPPAEVAQINNVTRTFQTPIVSPNTASLGWELQSGGFSTIIENADTGGGPPTFTNVNTGTDWVIPRPPVAVYHARWSQSGGGGSADGSSTAQATWVPLSGGLIINMDEEFDSTYQIIADVDISDDGGSTVLDSAVVDLTLIIDP
jgi:hypothetical protein